MLSVMLAVQVLGAAVPKITLEGPIPQVLPDVEFSPAALRLIGLGELVAGIGLTVGMI